MERILITSALPYINGIKHLGNLVGSQLPADVYARFRRARGDEVMFICATDEHGTPAEIAAQKAGLEVAQYCAEMHETQSKLAQGFRLSFDYFGRSSSPENHQLTQYFAKALAENGFIEDVEEEQIYSLDDKRFLPDRYIEGTCPNCGYEHARGDQCENCTKQLEPTALLNPRSAISGSENLETRKTRHLFLKQSQLRARIGEWIDTKESWPILTTSIAKKWLYDGDGLRDRGITRDLEWGVPVRRGDEEWEGMEGKVFYVWFDAPIEYIAATAEWAHANCLGEEAWERWWRLDRGADDVQYVQFMGKDNVPFHTISFPATIMGSGAPWKLVDYIKSFNYLNYEGGQFSTSLGRGIFMDQALEAFPSDYWRWWLLSHIPENADSEFTWENFVNTINKDLADVLGNFISRVAKFCRAKFGEVVPSGGAYGAQERRVTAELETRIRAYEGYLLEMEIRKAANELRAIWVIGNEYIQSAAPWEIYKKNPEGAAMIIRFALNIIQIYAGLVAPFIPDTSGKISEAFDLEALWPKDLSQDLMRLTEGQAFAVPETLFQKISPEMRMEMEERFGGAVPNAAEISS